jgi:hypothetical protein
LINSDTSFFAQGYWWGLQYYKGVLILHHSDDGFTSSIFQISNFTDNSIEGIKHEEGNLTIDWEPFQFKRLKIPDNERQEITAMLSGNWKLKEVIKPNLTRINQTLETGFIDGGGMTRKKLRLNLENLKDVNLQIELTESLDYKFIGNEKLNRRGKWSLSKDNKLICFDNEDINNNCFLFSTDGKKLILRKHEDIEIEYNTGDFTSEETELILTK